MGQFGLWIPIFYFNHCVNFRKIWKFLLDMVTLGKHQLNLVYPKITLHNRSHAHACPSVCLSVRLSLIASKSPQKPPDLSNKNNWTCLSAAGIWQKNLEQMRLCVEITLLGYYIWIYLGQKNPSKPIKLHIAYGG